MKILFLNAYQKQNNRGVETFVSELSKRLSKNHDVEIISEEKKIPEWRKTLLWRAFLDPNGRAVAAFTLKELGKIWNKKYDVVFPINGGWQPAFVRIVTWLYGGKMVISGQSGLGWHEKNNLWCFPDTFVALSTKALGWAKKVNPLVKSVYIPNGVDLMKFKVRNSKLKIADDKGRTVLAVGAFTEQKRLDLTIRAVAKLENVNLLIVGGGGDGKEELELLGRSLLGDRFKILSVPFEEMPEIYQRADVFTLPSFPTEAFGNVLVEAMASGLPIIATDDAIRREIVGNAGILIDPTNINRYADAIKEALAKKWGNTPRKQAEKFDWDKIALDYEKLFQNLNS